MNIVPRKWLSLAVASTILLSSPAIADSIDDFNNSWVGKALDMQRSLDNNSPMADNNILGTHNTYNSEAYTSCNFSVGCRYLDPQQKYSIKDQLRMGARFIELDVHWTTKMESLFSYPKRLLLCHGVCSINDKYATEGFNEVRDWLNDSTNADEVIIVYIEDHSDGRHGDLYNQLNSRFGDKIYRSNGCKAIPNTLTKADVLAQGKQVVLWKDGGCSSNSNMANMAFTSLGDIGRIWEDSTTLGTIAEFFSGGIESLSASDVRTAFETGANIVNLDDMVMNDGRIEAAVWSWDTNEPNDWGGNEDCASQWSNGRWNDANCGNQNAFACQNNNGDWAVPYSTTGSWDQGEAACQSLGGSYAFSVPTNSQSNQALKAAKDSAGYNTVWLNYADASVEGQWGSDININYSNTVGGNGGGAFDDANAYTTTSSLRITAVNLRAGSRIDAIGLTYNNGNSYQHGGGGGGAYSMALSASEFITRVEACSAYTSKYNTDTVHYMRLTTNQGNTLSGGSSGSGSCSTLVDGVEVVGFFGGAGSELDRVGVVYR